MIIPKHRMQSFFSNFLSESQFQPAGFDMTMKEVYRFSSPGKIDFDNKERMLSTAERIDFVRDEVFLPKGAYKVLYNEYVRIPSDVAAFCFPRSSLLRCGATLECAVWDPGYEGRSESLLVVHNENGIILKKNAKLGQIVFIKLLEETKELYNGRYKGENK
ncbi:MAG: deoxyuridine 5'-triphosphate nucleotidohydrolase [Candidatus Bilamarchaeaceae archaeon]